MSDVFIRVGEHLIARLDGPMHFRLIMQPIMAAALAMRAGLTDAREGRSPFLSTCIKHPEHRRELLGHAWSNLRKVLIVAAVLDVVYQIVVHRWIYLAELLITVAVLAIVPY